MQNNTFLRLYMGLNLIKLDRVASTNDYLREQLSNFKPLDEGSAIMATEQFQGKGQRGNIWRSEPGKNLTLSLLLYPSFLEVSKHFFLNVAISLGIAKWLQSQTTAQISVKWPNDIMANQKKVCGILIENQIKKDSFSSSIIGMGININQTDFPDEISHKVCSLKKLLQKPDDISIDNLLPELFHYLETQYERLKAGDDTELLKDYNSMLMWRGEKHNFLIDNVKVEGTITEVDKDGQLWVDFGKKVVSFNLKEIAYQL
ncbi:biotin--[acetyl-CoA-carboxylase] ligase [Sphingobacterium spiritivorum]|uniref:biotin--[acetyl-CoA-carboxylase] ligase n=2 Tax=Sphingobacterium spiritivorum TaxID=258 RepID=UPI003DA3F178